MTNPRKLWFYFCKPINTSSGNSFWKVKCSNINWCGSLIFGWIFRLPMIHFLSTSFSSQFCFYAFSFSLFLSSKWLFLKSSLLFHSYSNSPDEMNDMVDWNNFVYCNRRMNTLSTSLRPQMFLNHWSRYNLFSENCEAIQSLYYLQACVFIRIPNLFQKSFQYF